MAALMCGAAAGDGVRGCGYGIKGMGWLRFGWEGGGAGSMAAEVIGYHGPLEGRCITLRYNGEDH